MFFYNLIIQLESLFYIKSFHINCNTTNYIEHKYLSSCKKVIISPITKYLKNYVKDIYSFYNENNKSRRILQEIGNYIRCDLGKKDLLINRTLDDIDLYLSYFDAIIIPDIRLKREIKMIKEHFNNVVVINVSRPNFKTDLTNEEKNDITEIDLDNYDDYDYKVINNTLEDLKNITKDIVNKYII